MVYLWINMLFNFNISKLSVMSFELMFTLKKKKSGLHKQFFFQILYLWELLRFRFSQFALHYAKKQKKCRAGKSMCCSAPIAVYNSLCLPRNPDIIYHVYDYIKDYHSIFILLILLGSSNVYSIYAIQLKCLHA